MKRLSTLAMTFCDIGTETHGYALPMIFIMKYCVVLVNTYTKTSEAVTASCRIEHFEWGSSTLLLLRDVLSHCSGRAVGGKAAVAIDCLTYFQPHI